MNNYVPLEEDEQKTFVCYNIYGRVERPAYPLRPNNKQVEDGEKNGKSLETDG